MLKNVSVVFLVAAKPTTLVELSGFFLSFFFLSVKVQKKVKTVQTNMVALVWVINFKPEVRCDFGEVARNLIFFVGV